MAKIFLSHSQQDELLAEKLRNQLEQMNSKVYMFEHDQQLGTNIANKLEKEIRSSDIAFVLLTTHSKSSAYVQQEIGYAKGAGVRLVALVETGIDPSQLGMLAGIEYINLYPSNPDKSISDAQTYVHNHDIQRLYMQEAVLILLAVAVCAAVLYYAQSGQSTS